MANACEFDDEQPEQGPRIIVADLGFKGAGWDRVDGQPVIVLDESLSEQDRRRFLTVALNDIDSTDAVPVPVPVDDE